MIDEIMSNYTLHNTLLTVMCYYVLLCAMHQYNKCQCLLYFMTDEMSNYTLYSLHNYTIFLIFDLNLSIHQLVTLVWLGLKGLRTCYSEPTKERAAMHID